MPLCLFQTTRNRFDYDPKEKGLIISIVAVGEIFILFYKYCCVFYGKGGIDKFDFVLGQFLGHEHDMQITRKDRQII